MKLWGAEDIDVGKQEIKQVTFIVDKLKEIKGLEEFVDDEGFWKEIRERAKNFRPEKNEYAKKLNKKYLEYFNQTMNLDENKSETEGAKKALINAKDEIQKLIEKVKELEKDNPNWTAEDRKEVLENLSI